MRISLSLLLVLGFGIAGCTEPPYRYQIRDNGQGSISVETVPKTPPPAPANAAPLAASPASPNPPAVVASPAPAVTDQQRIEMLQAQVRALSEENQKLKQSAPATVPTTAPAKD